MARGKCSVRYEYTRRVELSSSSAQKSTCALAQCDYFVITDEAQDQKAAKPLL
jgi:hypothetical protein